VCPLVPDTVTNGGLGWDPGVFGGHTADIVNEYLPYREPTSISHLGEKENHLQRCQLVGDMLVPRRVTADSWEYMGNERSCRFVR